jgi:hypothetical protein
MPRMLRVISLALACASLCVPLRCPASAAATVQDSTAHQPPHQNPIPDHFVNLQVLPKDITKSELVGLMKQFSITFKVRCSYCHSVSDDLSQGRFDSDDKEPKRQARELLRMIHELDAAHSKAPATASAE